LSVTGGARGDAEREALANIPDQIEKLNVPFPSIFKDPVLMISMPKRTSKPTPVKVSSAPWIGFEVYIAAEDL
jgi:hypothetical protein